MIDCISVENMRRSDAYTIANLVPSLELMFRAADGVFHAVDWYGKIAIIAGSGNNGGDGYALACILKEKGFDCRVYSLGSHLSADSHHYAEIAQLMGVTIKPFDLDCSLSGYDYVVDCLLGTGFHGVVRDDYRHAIEKINSSGAYIVSVDINSGMNGDTGESDIAVKSDLTVTIGYVKHGLITKPAGKCMKKLVCTDIGIALAQKENLICSPEEWTQLCCREAVDAAKTMVTLNGQTYFRSPEWLDV